MRPLFFVWVLLLLPGASATDRGLLGEQRAEVAREAVLGRWEASIGKERLSLRFYETGAFALDGRTGSFRIEGTEIGLEEMGEEAIWYGFELRDHHLILQSGDLTQDLTFARAALDDAALQGYFRWLFDVRWFTVRERSFRILTILGVVLLAVGVVNLLRVVSAFLIFSEAGPLRYLYRRHKVKTQTVHSVVLNLIKYIIYFTALGHIFAEMGINYATYFASLSVIGLAVGFGSQGLVQDIVTGFFLLFDGQFGVGDMVEISGQTGVVTEMGLRTTRIRNFMGQSVVIPNRNIALVGNYSKGAVRAYVDVAIKDERAVRRGAKTLKTVCSELRRQFHGTVLAEPKDLGTLRLQTGEIFRRVAMDLWPQQHQAFIDGQLVPRIREAFARESIEIPSDRIAVSYRMPEAPKMGAWQRHLARRRKTPAPDENLGPGLDPGI